MQKYIEQGLADLYAALILIFDVTELTEPVHEDADAGPLSSDHLGKSLLGDWRNESLRFPRFAVFGHQQEYSSQASLAGVEQLVDQIVLGSHALCEHEP